METEISQLLDWIVAKTELVWQVVLDASFYIQIGEVLVAIIIAYLFAQVTVKRLAIFRAEPTSGSLVEIRAIVYRARELVFPAMAALALGIATQISEGMVGENWLIRAAQSIAFVLLIYRLATHFINNMAVNRILTGVGLPIALLHAIGWLDQAIIYMDSVDIEIGNIHLTLYTVVRTVIFGIILFWLGRISNNAGQRVIRSSRSLDTSTQEIAAKLFQIGVFVLIFIVLLQVMGIDVTTLVVFGGAVGVGLGFGLQQIAANFISGIIILIDRTITIGDYIELEDGRAGKLRELNMRSATLETFDGKDIMVPNERFITSAFVNWTHNNKKQRYSLYFSVAYNTDLEKLFDLVKPLVASHPQVLSGDNLPISERPDAEIDHFGDSGIVILVEFWMEGIDDGDNRVGGDLQMMIWTTLKANGISMPFPQREVRILNPTEPDANLPGGPAGK